MWSTQLNRTILATLKIQICISKRGTCLGPLERGTELGHTLDVHLVYSYPITQMLVIGLFTHLSWSLQQFISAGPPETNRLRQSGQPGNLTGSGTPSLPVGPTTLLLTYWAYANVSKSRSDAPILLSTKKINSAFILPQTWHTLNCLSLRPKKRDGISYFPSFGPSAQHFVLMKHPQAHHPRQELGHLTSTPSISHLEKAPLWIMFIILHLPFSYNSIVLIKVLKYFNFNYFNFIYRV